MKIVIVGAGASGLVAAICAAEHGADVTILECANKPAKKIYATGNGKCNMTNYKMDISCFHSFDLTLVSETLKRFTTEQTLAFFEQMGLMLKEKNGYVYPSTGQASTVAELLVKRCQELGVVIKCDTTVLAVEKKKKQFSLLCETVCKKEKKIVERKKGKEQADVLILAMGSRAGGFGCEITGTSIAARFGHRIIPEVPALTALKCKKPGFFKLTAGVRIDGKVTVSERGKKILSEDSGELQLTSYGISGIPVFQVSRFASYALKDKKKVEASIDFLPEFSFSCLLEKLQNFQTMYKNRTIEETLALIFHVKLVKGILNQTGIRETTKMRELSLLDLKKLLQQFKNFRVEVTGVNDLQNAQVCAGGVDTEEITTDFMSKKIPNLYIVGEMLDVDGICGGYNLQFAWASGKIAGESAAKIK